MTTDTHFDFNDLFVFDVANNHQGSVEHGLKIIRGVGEVARRHEVRGVVKFQFRDLDSLIHPTHREGSDAKHIPRFLETRLDRAAYQTLLDAVREEGMLASCTPFDEASVQTIVDMKFDIMKVASCSAKDWPLLEEISYAGLPVIFSTGGLNLRNIDELVSFFNHRGVDFAVMHCVGIYPTPREMCNLNQIEVLRRRYPGKVIGWSTHEDPDDLVPVQIAYAKGARIFERHVGVVTDEIKLNAYSSTPEQIDRWLDAYEGAVAATGPDERPPVPDEEQASMETLTRGVYAKKTIKKGTALRRDQVYFSMPFESGQLASGEWNEDIVATDDVEPDAPVMLSAVRNEVDEDVLTLKRAVHEVKALLNEAQVALSADFMVEYSHHYGIPKFRETGAVLIYCVNRDYAKKVLVQLPGQHHPSHFHKRKEETFQVLHGQLHLEVDGHEKVLNPGDMQTIMPGVWHQFWTDTGVVFEELSTREYPNDSFYRDKAINRMERSDRKTIVDHWGRFQLGQAITEPQSITE